MINIGSIAFLEPLVLSALIILPIVWWIVRSLPPPVKRVFFPPLQFLKDLRAGEPPPDRTPLWIIILRLMLATLLIFAFAKPVLNRADDLPGDGTILVVVDNGWEAASTWSRRIDALRDIAGRAAREGQALIILPTAPDPSADQLMPLSGSDVLTRLSAMEPVPWSPDHHALADGLASEPLTVDIAQVIWLSDGLEHTATRRLYDTLAKLASVDMRAGRPTRYPMALLPPEFDGLDIRLTAVRPARPFESAIEIEALARDGRRLAIAEANFDKGEGKTSARISLPQDLRNNIARLRIRGEASAGASIILDARAGRPVAGIATFTDASVPPLSTPTFYLSRAIEPFAAVTAGAIEDLANDQTSVLLVADVGRLPADIEQQISDWVAAGGVLVRFAGPRTANDPGPLVPVQLRTGGRAFGGAFTWDSAKKLRPFPPDSPFFGLPLPDDVSITRQLLAAPHPALSDKTWARLEDGTPLVTAATVGKGRIVLFHTTANAEWSNLALSGLFVGMLKRTLAFASTTTSTPSSTAALLAPLSAINAYGGLEPASPTTRAIGRDRLNEAIAGSGQPPGLYGPQGAALALNLASENGPVSPRFRFVSLDADQWPVSVGLGATEEINLLPVLLVAAFILALIDLAASQILKGQRLFDLSQILKRLPIVLVLLVLPAIDGQAAAQEIDEAFAVEVSAQARIGWVPTGNAAQDATIESGLRGLGRIMRIRTAVSLGEPVAVDPEQDPLNLFFMIYWPVPEGAEASPNASLRARRKLADYLRHGGMVLFDTGVGDPAGASLGLTRPDAQAALREVLKGVSLPGLAQVDENHVLSRSFYLLDRFPGRIRGRAVWVEWSSSSRGSANGAANSAVSGVVIGGGDWPAAWALDNRGMPLVRDLSGGEQQREMAFRFGINLVMYALTGTYKDDQLHMPIILNRLGE